MVASGHPERGGDVLGVHGVDEVGQAGAADHVRSDATVVENVAEVGNPTRPRAGLGALDDDDHDRLARGVADGDLTAPPSSIDGIVRYYTTVVQGLSIQAWDGP